MADRLAVFFRKPAAIAFLAFTGVYALALAAIFWGAWSLDRVPIAPDCATTFAVDDAATWLREVCGGKDFVPSDLMHVVGGMYFWVELQFALAAWLAALGVAFYLRGRRLSLVACYGGGAAFGLMGYCFTLFSAGHLGWFVWLMYGPFAFGLVDRCVRKGKWRNWALLGAVLAWASARQPDLWLLFTLLTFAYGVWCVVRERRTLRWGRLFVGVGVVAVSALLVGMPQFGHAIFHDIAGREKQITGSSADGSRQDKGKDADPAAAKRARQERWLFCTSWSLPPEDTLEFAVAEIHGGSNDPRIHQKPGNRPYQGRLGQHAVVLEGQGGRHPVTGETLKAGDDFWMPYRQHSLYFGLISLLLAGVGVAGWFLRRRAEAAEQTGSGTAWDDVPFWLGAALFVYLCALGGFTPFYRIVFALPFGDLMRCPVKFVHLLEFCVAVLAGFGLEFLRERFGAGRGWFAPALAVLAAVNVFDLARVDAKYLAVQDVSFQRAANDAAEDVLKLGGGKVYVALQPQEGAQPVRDALGLHRVETAVRADAPDTRFVLAGGSALRGDAALNDRLKSGALKAAGMYTLSKAGVRRAAQASASLALLQAPEVPAPAPKEKKPPEGRARALGFISILATLGVAAWSLAGGVFRRGAAVSMSSSENRKEG